MSVSQLEQEFSNPSSAFRGKPFWAWNDQLHGPELRRQIRIFERMGFGGFFMHSRVGLKTPYLSDEWFELVGQCIDEAGKTGAEAWLYDEDRWPSGAAGGLVTKDPEFQEKYLVMTRHENPERFVWPKNEIAYMYGATFEEEKITWYKKLDQSPDILILPQGAQILKFALQNSRPSPWYNNYTYLDTLSEKAVARFIEVTHEAYLKKIGAHFGKEVPGIFTDEPNAGNAFDFNMGGPVAIRWTPEFAPKFQELFGYDVLYHLPEIVFDLADKSVAQVRYHFYHCRTRLFVENFMKPIGEWCEKNKILFTGHLLAEEPISRCLGVVGSAMQCYPHMQAPGIDILTDIRLEYITAKQCSSIVHQTGRKWMLSELYGCTGWDMTFEGYKHSGDWQAVLGVTLRCPHLSWYSMAGEAKRDYPASIHFYSPWWKDYKFVEDYFSRLNVVLSEGEAVCDLAVIHPLESYYAIFEPRWPENSSVKKLDKEYIDLVRLLLGEHLDFDFADEQLLVEFGAKVGSDQSGAFLQIGKMKYRAVLAGPMITMRTTTLDILRKFAEAGGKVTFAGTVAELLDAQPSDQVKKFADGKTADLSAGAICAALGEKARRVSVRDAQNKEAADIFYQLRKIGDDWVIFLANTNRQTGIEQLSVRIQLDLPKGGQIQLWDPVTGGKSKLAGELTYRSASFKIDIPASGSRLIVISSQPQDIGQHTAPSLAGQQTVLGSEGWSFYLDDYNVVVLDRADAQAQISGKKKLALTKTEILYLDRQLREYIGIEPRGGAMTQPWRAKTSLLGPTCDVQLTYKFSVKAIPSGPVLLAMEQPERWSIKVNGRKLDTDLATGWWVDQAIKTLRCEPALLVRGKNLLTLEGQFDRLTDLEIIYLLGNFGVETDGRNISVTKFPGKLELGSWNDQGMPFYSGNVTYRTTFELQPDPQSRYFLKLAKFQAIAVKVILNGKDLPLAAWPDYQLDCTEFLAAGKNTIDVKILSSRRNSFGPFHLAQRPPWIGPREYVYNPDDPARWTDELQLIDYGLYEPPVLITCAT